MTRARNTGSSLIEVLVTMLILMLGLLGMAGLQGRALSAQMESYQRSQALILLKDMVDRVNANRANAASYVTAQARGTGFNSSLVASCAGLSGSGLDLCEWHNALLGATEVSGSSNVGAMIGARGCVYTTATNQYLVAVAWQGMSQTATPVIDCGADQYGSNDAYRRVVATPITIATLN